MSRICAVLGDPIEHSLSPALHAAAYAELGLDWEYRRHRVTSADLAGFVAGLGDRWRGLSLTMPLKEAVLALGSADETVRRVGAGNTLLLGPDPQVRNTDVGGLQRALAAADVAELRTGLLLGTGATARSSLVALAGLGTTRITVLARTPSRAEPLRRLGVEIGVEVTVLAWPQPAPGAPAADPTTVDARAAGSAVEPALPEPAPPELDLPELDPPDVTVSTVVAGAADPLAAWLSEISPVLFDVVYDPWPTPLARAGARAGRTVLNGLDLLVHQAVEQVELMTGRPPSPAVLLAAGQAALNRRPAGGEPART